jgi:serine protease
LPTDGSTYYVRLWTGFATGYQYNDYTFKASGGAKAVMTAPGSSSVLSGSSVTFTWSAASGATSYWLDVGTVAGGFNLYTQGEGQLTSQTVTGLPTGGSTIYVRLWSAINGVWQYSDSTYKAAP